MSHSHGHTKNKNPSTTYSAWAEMKKRCLNKNTKRFHDYGGRGITVCDRWMQFENFLCDMGECPQGLTLERKDNDKGYSPDNCKWATRKEQQRNTRASRFITFDGKTLTLAGWTELLGLKRGTVRDRILAGWSIERAVTSGPQSGNFMPGHDSRRYSIKAEHDFHDDRPDGRPDRFVTTTDGDLDLAGRTMRQGR